MNAKNTFKSATAIAKVIAVLTLSTVGAFAHADDDTKPDDGTVKPLHCYIIPICDAPKI
jgi:hypothetical protein